MGNLLFGRRTNFLHSNVEVEVLAREWVVAIDGDVIVIDFEHADRDRPLLCVRLKLHAHFKRFHALKTVARYHLLERRIGHAIAILRSYTDFHSFACSFSDKRSF